MMRGKDAIQVAGIAIVLLVTSGCSNGKWSWKTGGKEQHAVNDKVETRPMSDAAPADERTAERPADEPIIPDVQEFLERTKVYEESGESASSKGPVAAGAGSGDSPDAATGQSEQDVRAIGSSESPAGNRVADARVTEPAAEIKPSPVAPPKPEPAAPTLMGVHIRGSDSDSRSARVDGDMWGSNRSAVTRSNDDAIDVDQTLRALERDALRSKDFDAIWRLQLARLAFGRSAERDREVASMSSKARRVLDAAMDVTEAARRVARDPNLPGNDALAEAHDLATVLAERADLAIPEVKLCRKVVTYGVYEELETERFVAGQPIEAILYVEVENFGTKPVRNNLHRTKLATRLELMTSDGRSLWTHEEPEIVDDCRRRRRDFFIAQRVSLPSNLPAGDLVLKVLVTDKQSGKAQESTLPITMSGSSVATRG